jgi:diacylglycerol O-acyltransferase
MSQPDLRRRMRGSDAMFLYFERKEMPLHIGSVAVLDGPFDEESEALLAARLHEIPRYRQRVMFSPMNLTHPAWEDDPEFDIQNHIRHITLPSPGSEQQLSEVAGEVFTPMMDRAHPLWDLTVVDGLDGNRAALILRVHHSMVDGISGISLVNALFDTTREPRGVDAKPFSPPPLPDSKQLLVEGLAGMWAESAERLIGAQVTLLKMAHAFLGDSSRTSMRALLATIPDLLRPTERLPFNGPCSGVRGYCWTSSPFAEARAIRSVLGGTINDVILSVVAGAVARYVMAHREPVRNRFVRLMIPVNLRTEDPNGRVGNEISMLPLSLPLDIDDPAERLRVVAKRSAAMKAAHIADVVQLIGIGLGWTPPTLQHFLAELPFMPQREPALIVNMVCTNVPGPMVPLYSNGHELLTYYPYVPCGSDVGISVAISSYNQKLYYGVTSDAQAAPDADLFRDFLVEAYEELREAAGIRPTATSEAARKPTPSVVPESIRVPKEPAEPLPAVVTTVTESAPAVEMTAPVELITEAVPGPVRSKRKPRVGTPVKRAVKAVAKSSGRKRVQAPAAKQRQPSRRKAKRASATD